jgi:hypothetical protein
MGDDITIEVIGIIVTGSERDDPASGKATFAFSDKAQKTKKGGPVRRSQQEMFPTVPLSLFGKYNA